MPASVCRMDPSTAELRDAHDRLAELYADVLAGELERAPVERSVLGLFCELVLAEGAGRVVGDIGSGSGRLAPFLAARGLEPRGVDLSPEMVRVARRDHPDFPFELGDVRALPFPSASLAGAVCWYSLMYLSPADRPRAYAELARVVRPGGYLVTAFKAGDGTRRRGGQRVGVAFDIYWQTPQEVRRAATDAGFQVVSWTGRPAGPDDDQPQGYLVARRG
jgi:ubiquinone/menaquinone biosynthesis C-methylase UbiE